jgi:F-type H+-transporting ATPase subunit gamma
VASPREIRRRIRSVRNTAQITRAMEMVAAAKMRRAQERVRAARPYSERIRTMVAGLTAASGSVEPGQFPLLDQRPINKVSIILLSSDRGLKGAFNSNVIRRAARFIRDEAGHPVELLTIGRKGRDFFARTRYDIVAEFTDIGDAPGIETLRPAINVAVADFISGKTDAVYLIYTKFINTLSQVPEVLQILPVVPPVEATAAEETQDYIFEPDPVTVLQALLPRYIETQLYQATLESIASEHSAQMVAMRAATDAARDFINELTLSLNKARQSQITREVAEISAGASALTG